MKLTKDEIDVIIEMLEDIDRMWGLRPEEQKLYDKIMKER